MKMLAALWEYRGFILSNVQREFKLRYQNSLLGAAWAILQPLAMILIYTVIFSQVMRAKLPGIDNTFGYSIFLCAGILTWGLFTEITTRSQNIFLENANLLKKINFPRICLPATVILSALINFGIIFALFTLFLIISQNFPGIAYLALAPMLLILITFATGLGIILGVLNVFFRDVGQFFSIFITYWFWLTPIVYPISIIPEKLRPLLALNPMTHIITACQNIVLKNELPQLSPLLYPAALAVILCIVALRLFRKRAGEMVDEL